MLDARNGNVITTIHGGAGAHNTVVSLDGHDVYLGGRDHNYLRVADTQTNRVFRNIGPLRGGVRPFTINGRQTLAYTTATGFLGFQVSSISSGQVLYTQAFPASTGARKTSPRARRATASRSRPTSAASCIDGR